MSNVLTITNLTKHFGKVTAVDSLNLTIASGQVYGILGPNGSGKTTTLGMILEVVAPTSGKFSWFGGMDAVKSRQQIGSILETPCFYGYLTAVQNLRIVAHIKNCSEGRIEAMLEQVNLYERKDDKFKTYSLGMKQRLSIAAALLSDPPVLILDEPTNGLDPEGIVEVRDLIIQITSVGKTVIIASHLLDEVQKICTHFCILRKGIKLYEGSVKDLLGETNIVEIVTPDLEKLSEAMLSFKGQEKTVMDNGSLFIHLKDGVSSEDINKHCVEKGIPLRKLLPQTKSLEQEFLKILKEND